MSCNTFDINECECVADVAENGATAAGVLVVGASSGMGKETAKRYAAAGNNVVLAARRLDKLNAIVSEINGLSGGTAYAVQMDARDEAEVASGVSGAVAWLAGPTGGGRQLSRVLIFTALDQGSRSNIADIDASKRIMDFVYWTVKNVSKAVVPVLKATSETEDVRLYLTGSLTSSAAVEGRDTYGSGKAAITRLAKQIEIENPFLIDKVSVGYWSAVNSELVYKQQIAADTFASDPGATGLGRYCPPLGFTINLLAPGSPSGAAFDEALIFFGIIYTQYSSQPSEIAEIVYNNVELGRREMFSQELGKLTYYNGFFDIDDVIYANVYQLLANIPSGFALPPGSPNVINPFSKSLVSWFTDVVKGKLDSDCCYKCKLKSKLKNPKTPIQRLASRTQSLDLCNSLISIGLEQELNAYFAVLVAGGYPLDPVATSAVAVSSQKDQAAQEQLDGLEFAIRSFGSIPLAGSSFTSLTIYDGNDGLAPVANPATCPYEAALYGTLGFLGLNVPN